MQVVVCIRIGHGLKRFVNNAVVTTHTHLPPTCPSLFSSRMELNGTPTNVPHPIMWWSNNKNIGRSGRSHGLSCLWQSEQQGHMYKYCAIRSLKVHCLINNSPGPNTRMSHIKAKWPTSGVILGDYISVVTSVSKECTAFFFRVFQDTLIYTQYDTSLNGNLHSYCKNLRSSR